MEQFPGPVHLAWEGQDCVFVLQMEKLWLKGGKALCQLSVTKQLNHKAGILNSNLVASKVCGSWKHWTLLPRWPCRATANRRVRTAKSMWCSLSTQSDVYDRSEFLRRLFRHKFKITPLRFPKPSPPTLKYLVLKGCVLKLSPQTLSRGTQLLSRRRREINYTPFPAFSFFVGKLPSFIWWVFLQPGRGFVPYTSSFQLGQLSGHSPSMKLKNFLDFQDNTHTWRNLETMGQHTEENKDHL